MKIKNIIFKSEQEFRKYIMTNFKNITKIYVFEDFKNNAVFFYCFFQKEQIVISKEISLNKYTLYKRLYQEIITEFQIPIQLEYQNIKSLKLTLKKG